MISDNLIVSSDNKLVPPVLRNYSEYCLQSLRNGCHRVAFVNATTGEETRYNELLQNSINLACAFRRMNVKRGDMIGIISENRVEFVVAMLASWFVGAAFTPISKLSTPGEIRHAFSMTSPSKIFVTLSKLKDLQEALKTLNSQASVIVFENAAPHGITSFNYLVSQNADLDVFQVTPIEYDDVMLVLYSSGTTGVPKGVDITNDNLLQYPSILRSTFNSLYSEPDSTILAVLSFNHVFGFSTILSQTISNVKTVLVSDYTQESLLKILEKFKITVAFVVPTLLNFLANHPDLDKYDLSSLRHICTGGGKVSIDIIAKLKTRIPIKVRDLYGSTETGMTAAMSETGLKKFGSIGQVVPTFQVKVVNPETEEILGPYQRGELRFKGPLVMKCYRGPKDIINTAFDFNGFYKSGDIGYYDKDRHFFIVDRMKELIKYKSYQVAPAEIEEVLLQHKAVKEAGVLGLPDSVAGELPLAFIVKQPNHNVHEKDILDFVASRVSPYKKLRGGIIFVDSLPKNPMGKLVRKEIKEMLKAMKASKL